MNEQLDIDPIAEKLELAINNRKGIYSVRLAYIEFFDLGGGNWTGGLITRTDTGLVIGKISYNGRIWADEPWTPNTKEIIP